MGNHQSTGMRYRKEPLKKQSVLLLVTTTIIIIVCIILYKDESNIEFVLRMLTRRFD